MPQKVRIAHVDDDPDIRDTVSHILSVNGYKIDSYQTMADFIGSLENSDISNLPALAILDVMVESMDAGLNAYVHLHKRFPSINAIFLTSLGDMIRPYFEDKSSEWVCVIEKPVEPISLLSIVRSRLNDTETIASPS